MLLQDPAHPGSFLAAVTYSHPWGAIDVAVGDLNGDGNPILSVASLGPAAHRRGFRLAAKRIQPWDFWSRKQLSRLWTAVERGDRRSQRRRPS